MASYDKTNKGSASDISGKVMPLPVINRIDFYATHMDRCANSIRELYMDLTAVQDRLYAEVIEFENCVIELQEEILRIQRIFKDVEAHEKTDR